MPTIRPDREHIIQACVSSETRRRLIVVKMLIQFLNPQNINPTWDDAIEWLLNVVPVDDLYVQAVQERRAAAAGVQQTEQQRVNVVDCPPPGKQVGML